MQHVRGLARRAGRFAQAHVVTGQWCASSTAAETVRQEVGDLKSVDKLMGVVGAVGAAVGESVLTDSTAFLLMDEQVSRVEVCVEGGQDPRRELQIARQLMKHLVEEGHSIGERCYSRLVEACALAGDKDLAEKYMEQAEAASIPLNLAALNALLLLPKYGHMREEFLAFIERRGLRPNTQTYEFLLLAIRDAGDAPAAMSLLNRLKADGISTPAIASRTMQTLIVYFANANDFERLNSTVLTMLAGGMPHDVRMAHELPVVLAACARHAKQEDPAPSEAAALAEELWGSLVRLPGEEGLPCPPLACYHSMLRVHEAAVAPAACERIIADLEARGEVATDAMWARAAEAHSRAGNAARCAEIQEEWGIDTKAA